MDELERLKTAQRGEVFWVGFNQPHDGHQPEQWTVTWRGKHNGRIVVVLRDARGAKLRLDLNP